MGCRPEPWTSWRNGPLPRIKCWFSDAVVAFGMPLAVVVMGGLITSSLLTLVVLPVLYGWVEERQEPGVARAGHK